MKKIKTKQLSSRSMAGSGDASLAGWERDVAVLSTRLRMAQATGPQGRAAKGPQSSASPPVSSSLSLAGSSQDSLLPLPLLQRLHPSPGPPFLEGDGVIKQRTGV